MGPRDETERTPGAHIQNSRNKRVTSPAPARKREGGRVDNVRFGLISTTDSNLEMAPLIEGSGARIRAVKFPLDLSVVSTFNPSNLRQVEL